MLDNSAPRPHAPNVQDRLEDHERRLVHIETRVGKLESDVGPLAQVMETVKEYIADARRRQPDREIWDKTQQEQLANVSANTHILMQLQQDKDYRKVATDARWRSAIRALGTLLGGSIVPMLALYFSGSSGRLNSIPVPLIALMAVGAVLGFIASWWLTAEVPPKPAVAHLTALPPLPTPPHLPPP